MLVNHGLDILRGSSQPRSKVRKDNTKFFILFRYALLPIGSDVNVIDLLRK